MRLGLAFLVGYGFGFDRGLVEIPVTREFSRIVSATGGSGSNGDFVSDEAARSHLSHGDFDHDRDPDKERSRQQECAQRAPGRKTMHLAYAMQHQDE